MEVTPVTQATDSSAAAPGPVNQSITNEALPTAIDTKSEPETKEEAVKPDDRFSSKFAALAKREKQLQARESKLKEMETKVSSYSQFEVELKKNPIATLKKYGLTYEDLTHRMLNDDKPTAEQIAREAQDRVERFERELKEKEEKQAQQNYDREIQRFVQNIQATLDANKDKYELTLASPGGHELVYNVIEANWNENQKVLSIEDAAELVEKHLEAEAEKYMGLNKLKSKFAPVAAPVAAPAAANAPQSPKTLSNSHQTEVPAPSTKSLSIDQSKEIAAKILRWT